jgi:hypothetical protein
MLFHYLRNQYGNINCPGRNERQSGRFFWISVVLTFLLSMPGCVPEIAAQSIYPAFTNYSIPSPMPPAPGDVFAPAMDGVANAAAPAGAEWTRTAGPDESVLLTGSHLSTYTDSSRGKDTHFMVYDGTVVLKEANLQRVDSSKAIITLPANTVSWGMYLVWPGNESGYGKPLSINKTDAWWVGPEKATRGATVSVFGRNLAHNNDTLTSNVYIKPIGGTGQWAAVTQVNPYRVAFTVPANLTDGDYEVWTHNGHGQEYGWSGPLKLTVYGGAQWAGPIVNVRTYGATGNGTTDDTQAIRQALVAARQLTGSTVYFPTGTYSVSDVLDIASYTRWKGDGPTSVLQCSTNFSVGTETMVRGNVENVEICNLTIAGNHNYRGIHAEPIYLRGSRGLWITNVHFSFQGSNILQLHESYGVYINNCDFIGKGSYLGTGSQLFINNCHFRLTNDAEMALDSWGGSSISLTNSTCQDFDNSNPADSTGWGKGRFYAGRGNFGSSSCTYVGNNRTIDLAVRPIEADQNSGEQFLWEGYFTDWSGTVDTSTAATTTLKGFSTSYNSSHYAIITKGTGMGQSRRVTNYNGSCITLESDWNVLPDNTSVVALANVNDRAVMYGNSLDGKAYSVTAVAHNASAGIEPYGATMNFIADKNTLHDLRIGMTCWSTQQSGNYPDPSFFGLFVNNSVINCRWAILNGLYMNAPKNANLFGITYRRNQASGVLESAIVNVLMPTMYRQALSFFAYEHNNLQAARGYSTGGDIGLPLGFASDGNGIADQFFYKNSFSSSASTANFGIQVTTAALVRENSLSGFVQPYAATLLRGELEAPYHVLELTGASGAGPITTTLTLWNSGMSVLNWRAASDAAWLTLAVASGSIPDEHSSNMLLIQAAIAGLVPGSYQATITVTANGDVKKYMILLKVTAGLSIRITSPVASSQLVGTSAILINADALLPPSTATISKVEFYVDSIKVGETGNVPYQHQWVSPLAGPHKLAVRALTTEGMSVSSAQVEVTVYSGPLPVTLLDFTAQSEEPAGVRLRWTTAAELNNAGFTVERSLDARTFAAVGAVAGAGNSAGRRDYTLLDAELPAGAALLYYRLRQTDFGGAFSYSPVRTVALARLAAGFAVYPTQVSTGQALTYLYTGPAGPATLQVLDLMGRAVRTIQLDGRVQGKMPTVGLPSGAYLLRYATPTAQLAARCVIE